MKRLCLLLPLLLALTLPAGASDVIISEFMAVNNKTLLDEDKEYSDWIEIYNSGNSSVDLGGWYLTDTDGNLMKWQFPSTNLPPKRFLVVFASNKDRRVPGLPLHTNFKLSGSGQYLALVMPDGLTPATEFASKYPQQYADISYGYLMNAASTNLLVSGATVRALVPSSDIGTTWRSTNFNAAGWLSGSSGVGYDSTTNYAPAIGLDLRSAMSNINASAYVRASFSLTNPASVQSLLLRMRYDDGFVAWVNGVEVARRNAPASLSWNSTATGKHGAAPPTVLMEGFEGTSDGFLSNAYGTLPGPVVEPADAGSTGHYLRLLQMGATNAANTVSFPQVSPGLHEQIIADFDFRMSSTDGNPGDGFNFMLIPTAVYGTNGPGLDIAGYPSPAEEPDYPGVFAVGFDVYPHDEPRNDVSAHWNGTGYLNVTIPKGTLDLVGNVFHHAQITLQHVTDGARVSVTITPDINGTPGSPFAAINNLYIPGLDPYGCRVQFSGRSGETSVGLDLDNVNVQFVPSQGVVAFEEFDISGFRSALVAGVNVLAIQGMNVAADDRDFLIVPELKAYDFPANGAPTYLTPATPGSSNNVTAAGKLAPVVYSQPAGVYTSNTLKVALSSASSSATIRYTVNGSTPTTTSTLYTGPITVSGNTAIRAVAYETRKIPSEISAANYVLLDSSLTGFDTKLPVVILDTLGGTLSLDAPISGYVVLIDTNTPTGRISLTSPPNHLGRANLEYRGQSSAGFPKKSMNMEIDDELGEDLKAPLLGMPKGSDWALYAPYTDKTFMNDVLAYDLHEAMGNYAVRRRFVEVFLRTSSGKLAYSDYQGIFVLLEKPRVAPERIDIAKLGPGDKTEPDISGGYVFKKDKTSPSDVLFGTSSGQTFIYHDPKGTELTDVQRLWLVNYINKAEAALYGSSWTDPTVGYAAYLDVPSFVDMHWIVEFNKNIDGYRLSNFLHKDRNGKIVEGPIWDWNLSLGNANYLEGGKTNGWYYPLCSATDDLYLSRLRADADFYQKIVDRWGELRTNVMNLSNLLTRVSDYTNLLQEAQVRDFQKWPRLGAYIWPNPNGPSGGWDVDFQYPTTYAGIISEMKKWIVGRHMWVDSQFVKAPAFSMPGGPITPGVKVTVSAPAGSIYYTTDGSDPRASLGRTNSAARLYSGAITITNNVGLVARAVTGSSWSPPTKAVYVASTPLLRITEIMYHPEAPSAPSLYTDEDFEYVEIKNTGPVAINLGGTRLGGGIDFTFPANKLVPGALATSNSFDGAGTTYTTSRLGAAPAAAVTTGGPAGSFLRLLGGGTTNLTRNRATFNQTTAGSYSSVVAEFDFRASMVSPVWTNLLPTLQNFDSAGTDYVLANTGATAATILPPDAGSSGSFLRLVPALGSENGSIGFTRTATGVCNTVVATFDFRITPAGDASQADGFAFALVNTTSYGVSGASPALGEEANLLNSIGVGFDVYNNSSTASTTEPDNNHLSLHWNNAQVGNAASAPFDISNGQFHRAQIVVRFADGSAYVTVRLTPDINGTPGATCTLFQDTPIAGVAPYESRAAFAARTGGAAAAHDLDNIDIEYIRQPGTTAGLSLLMLPATQFGTNGAGTTLASFTDLPRVANALALDLAFGPSNLMNDATLYWSTAKTYGDAIPPSALDIDSGVFHHARLQLDPGTGGIYASLLLTPNSLGTPGASFQVMARQFVSGPTLANSRVELAGRNGGYNTILDVENLLVTYYVPVANMLGAGESVLVVRNRSAFESRYGAGYRIAGEFTGQLNNAGDHITLYGPVGEPILDFEYKDGWYPITDGLGYSLVIRDPNGAVDSWDQESAWRPSSQLSGSPGTNDAAPAAIAPILVNEAVANTYPPEVDRVELFNPTGEDVDIGGWFLTDAFFTPKKFRIPPHTVIRAGDYLVFSEADFNADPSLETSFALNDAGDDIWLFSADSSGNLTGYVHGYSFGPSEEGVSFGRHVAVDGTEHFAPQVGNSFGEANLGPRIGPLVINEIMFQPPDIGGTNDNTVDEFIEIYNLSPDPVPLFDLVAPMNTWRLKGGIDFAFPTNVLLWPGEFVLVVNFDPTNTTMLSTFRVRYAVSPDVQIFGPYGGKLNNGGDNLELKKPILLHGTNTAWVNVDKVEYSSQYPWPCGASGSGASLQRQQTDQFGNDALNSGAASPTAGQPNPLVPPSLPGLTAPPQDRVVLAGETVVFTIGVCGTPPFTYQWLFKGGLVNNETNGTLVISNAQAGNLGGYSVIVANASGSITSAPAMLYFPSAPVIVRQPQSVNVTGDVSVAFSVQARGPQPMEYQWLFRGTNLPGATAPVLELSHVQVWQAGDYSVVVSNPYGQTTSSNATLSLSMPCTILEQPKSLTVSTGSTNTQSTNTVVLSVTVGSMGPPSFQWTLWGTNLPGATNSSLAISNVALAHAGPYAVRAWDAVRTARSDDAFLTVLVKPYIVVPIQGQSVVYGGTASFSVVAGPEHPTLPMTYQWMRNGAFFLTNDVPTLILTNVTIDGAYLVKVVNAAGSANRGQVTLKVLTDTDRDGVPDSVELAMGYPTNAPADGAMDYDGDGMSNADEVAAGTDPKDPSSVLRLTFPAAAPVVDGRVQFSFVAMSNRTYSVEYRDGLGTGGWSNLTGLDSLPTNRVIWTTNSPPPGLLNRFYRVKVPRNQ